MVPMSIECSSLVQRVLGCYICTIVKPAAIELTISLNAGPEVWQQTQGRVTHFISSMGTTGVSRCTWQTCSGPSDHVVLHTGTIMGVSKFLKGQNQDIQIIGLQPKEGAKIPGIRRWPKEYLPKIFQVGVLRHAVFRVAPEPSEQA